MGGIAAWLEEIGLGQHAELFEANDITVPVLPELTDDDLKELGISLGHRRLLLRRIKDLDSTPPEGGASAPHSLPAHATMPARPHAERRQLTVMFVDLVGSTALAARLDPEEMREVITAFQNRCAEVIRRSEGHVAKYMGDGVLAYFGYPQAHEDSAERAVRAGLEVAAAISRQEVEGAALAARIGIATGQVVVGDLIGEGAAQEEAVVGDTPNLAARLQALAGPGTVLIAEATRRLLGAGFELADLGPQEVKGLAKPVGAFVVRGERPVPSRFEARTGPALSPMVGRDQELALLLERWAQAKRGEGQGVLLVGEAGIGKSRIVRALLDAIAAEPHTRIRYQCSPYHSDSALWPVIQQLIRAAGFADDDSIEAKLDKLEALLAQGGGHDAAPPLIADLLGLDAARRYGAPDLTPQVRRARTLGALGDQLLGLAARQPTLMVLEDAHWIDPSTLELIGAGLDRVADHRVMMLVTSRPDNQPELAAHPHVTRLTLNRLSRTGVETIVARLGGDHLPAHTIATIIARADGVPLFVEELTKSILETSETTIPASLHDSLMARLDRLPEVKEVAQLAACIGRAFDFSLLAAVAQRPEDQLQASLDKLVAAELVFRRGSPPDASYTFKHALVRDAAYQSLLRSKRGDLHGRIASTLERQFPETADAEPELLAQHFAEAGKTGCAIDYWNKAGRHALERSAYTEAVAHLNTGLKMLGSAPLDESNRRRELDLQTALGVAFMATRGWSAAEAREAYQRARRISEELADTENLCPILSGIWMGHQIAGEFFDALKVASEWLHVAQERGDGLAVGAGHRAIGQTLIIRGELASARHHLEQAIALYDPERDAASAVIYRVHSKAAALVYLSHALWLLGYPDQAWQTAVEALHEAEQQNGAHDLVHAMLQASHTRLLRREYREVQHLTDQVLGAAREYGLGAFVPGAEKDRDAARLASDNRLEDVEQVRRSLSSSQAGGNVIRHPFRLGMLADGLAANGRTDEAFDVIDQAMEITKASGDRWSDAELHRVRGKIVLARDGLSASGEAEACFRRSLDIARHQSAKSWELRTATSLAQLWAEQGKRTEAHDLLAAVYGWFTEGFDTADLMEAKALLDDLA